ncbi:MAG: tetratricopeptide repeat protein [Verrucomicrobiae bacterium]|nr:tetratricopeptide repeat protein [Verrucomicrobiae bacterium]
MARPLFPIPRLEQFARRLSEQFQNDTPLRAWVILSFTWLVMGVLHFSLMYMTWLPRAISGDSVFHFIYLRSAVFDGDLDFTNEFRHFQTDPASSPFYNNPTGKPGNIWAIGPALFWMPAYLVAAGLESLGQPSGPAGYSTALQMSVYLADSFLGLLGIVLTFQFLRGFFSYQNSLLAALSILLCSSATYYFWCSAPVAHNASLFASALLFFLITRKTSLFWTGMVAGLLVCTRWQAALWIPLLVLFLLWEGKVRTLRNLIVLGAGMLLGVSPQLVAFKLIYGAFLFNPGISQPFGFVWENVWLILFSTNHGLFLWHPLLILAIPGWTKAWGPFQRWILLLGILFVVQVVINATRVDPNASWSFGHRRFDMLLPAFAFGIAAFIQYSKPWVQKGFPALLILLAVWNQLFIFQFQHGLIPRSTGLTFREFVTAKFTLWKEFDSRTQSLMVFENLRNGEFPSFVIGTDRLYKQNPEFRCIPEMYALSCLMREDYQSGRAIFHSLHARFPDNPLFAHGLLTCLWKTGARDQAAALLKTIPQTQPSLLNIEPNGLPPASEHEPVLKHGYFERYIRWLSDKISYE